MKAIFSLLILGSAISFSACGQKLDPSKVPVPVKESFSKQFPRATPKWEKEDGNFEAGFKQDNHEMSALFEANGTMTELELAIKITELPSAVTDYISKTYKGAAIKEAAKITKSGGEINYEAEVKGTDLIFNASGAFLKQIKE